LAPPKTKRTGKLAEADIKDNSVSTIMGPAMPASWVSQQDIAETSCRGELIHGKLCDLLQHLDFDKVQG